MATACCSLASAASVSPSASSASASSACASAANSSELGTWRSRNWRICASGCAPTKPSTGCPWSNSTQNGIERTPNAWLSCPAISGCSSLFSLANEKRPAYSRSSFSSTGLSVLHGPHQGAQMSSSTGVRVDAWISSVSKFWMVMSIMAAKVRRWRRIGASAAGAWQASRGDAAPTMQALWLTVQRETVSSTDPPVVGVLMGSSSDWETLQHAAAILAEFGVPHECRVVSAHRMPDDLFAYADSAQSRGLRAIIAGAGGAAHLPGMLAAKTVVPVLGVPVPSRHLQGVDSLHSIVQMPRGIPVATFAIGSGGAANAALFAIAMLAATDPGLRTRLDAWRAHQTEVARAMTTDL